MEDVVGKDEDLQNLQEAEAGHATADADSVAKRLVRASGHVAISSNADHCALCDRPREITSTHAAFH